MSRSARRRDHLRDLVVDQLGEVRDGAALLAQAVALPAAWFVRQPFRFSDVEATTRAAM
ncbi:MAG TPA: hypothetical protein VM822_08445 [Pseudolabrys sp.]|nr:hypothetical protein [Pseudolabrys sp.]